MCHLGQGEARRGSGKEQCLPEGTSMKNDLKEQKFLGRFLPQPSGLAVRPHGSGRPRAQRGACAPSLGGVFATNPVGRASRASNSVMLEVRMTLSLVFKRWQLT